MLGRCRTTSGGRGGADVEPMLVYVRLYKTGRNKRRLSWDRRPEKAVASRPVFWPETSTSTSLRPVETRLLLIVGWKRCNHSLTHCKLLRLKHRRSIATLHRAHGLSTIWLRILHCACARRYAADDESDEAAQSLTLPVDFSCYKMQHVATFDTVMSLRESQGL